MRTCLCVCVSVNISSTWLEFHTGSWQHPATLPELLCYFLPFSWCGLVPQSIKFHYPSGKVSFWPLSYHYFPRTLKWAKEGIWNRLIHAERGLTPSGEKGDFVWKSDPHPVVQEPSWQWMSEKTLVPSTSVILQVRSVFRDRDRETHIYAHVFMYTYIYTHVYVSIYYICIFVYIERDEDRHRKWAETDIEDGAIKYFQPW